MLKILKGVYTIVSNKTADVIDAAKNALIDISKDKDVKNLLANVFIGIGVIGILIKVS